MFSRFRWMQLSEIRTTSKYCFLGCKTISQVSHKVKTYRFRKWPIQGRKKQTPSPGPLAHHRPRARAFLLRASSGLSESIACSRDHARKRSIMIFGSPPRVPIHDDYATEKAARQRHVTHTFLRSLILFAYRSGRSTPEFRRVYSRGLRVSRG